METAYTTPQLLEVSGATPGAFAKWVSRQHLVLSGGQHPGTGNRRKHSKDDVLAAALIVKLGRVGIGPKHARLIFAFFVVPNLHRPEALILLSPRDDGSDIDIRIVVPPGDDGLGQPGAPTVFAAIDLGGLKREVCAKLAALGSVS